MADEEELCGWNLRSIFEAGHVPSRDGWPGLCVQARRGANAGFADCVAQCGP